MRRYSQSSSCHQCFYIISVNIQGLIVLIHGFHMAAIFEVIHTCTYTESTKTDINRFILVSSQKQSVNCVCHPNFRITISRPMKQTVSS